MKRLPVRLAAALAALAAALSLLAFAPATLAQQVPMVSGKSTHTLGLDVDGVVYGWGADAYGQLGTGRVVFVPFPVKVLKIPAIATFAAGDDHLAAVDTLGYVWTWGGSSYGKLGQRSRPETDAPGRVEGLGGVVEVAAGGQFTLARKGDGSVWYWGTIPGVGSSTRPVRLAAIPAAATGIAAGERHFLVLLGDGTVWVAGANETGQLGLGASSASSAGQVIPGFGGAALVRAMRDTSAVLVGGSPNRPHAWGRGFTASPAALAVAGLPPGANVGDIHLRDTVVTALLSNGDVWHWADGVQPSAVGGTANAWNVPIPTGGLGTGRSAVYGWNYNFELRAWGANTNGALGLGTVADVNGTPVAVPAPDNVFERVRGGVNFAAGRKLDGTLWVWGNNAAGQLGNATVDVCRLAGIVNCPDPRPEVGANADEPVATRPRKFILDTPEEVAQVSAGYSFSLARTVNNEVLAWGRNGSGQLGTGNTASVSRPRKIAGFANVVDIAAGAGHALFAKGDGTVWETGAILAATPATVPRQVTVPEPVARVFTGAGTAFAVTAGGKLYAWGANGNGQLGLGDTASRATPTVVAGTGPGGAVVVEVSAGPTHTLARTATGAVYAWGANESGQLGDGTQAPRLLPAAVPGVSPAASVAAGYRFSVVALADGTVRAFGLNAQGQVGDGTNASRLSPVAVADLDVATNADPRLVAGIAQVTAGYATAVALRTGGTVYAWGTSGTSPDASYLEVETLGDAKLVPRNRPSLVLHWNDLGLLDNGVDWFLDLDPPLPDNRPTFTNRSIVPVTRALVSAGELYATASINFRLADYGKRVGTYVLGIVPPAFLSAAKVAKGTSLDKAMKAGEMVLVMLTPDGWTTVTGQLVAFTTSVIAANGGANTILDNIPTAAVTGATFCIGYGTDTGNMVAEETLAEVLVLPGAGASVGGVPCLVAGAYVNGPASSNAGSPATFKALVIGTSPTGKVFFRDNATTISGELDLAFPNPANETVASAAYTTSALAAGQHSIAVTYRGDLQNRAADSAYGVNHVVSPVAVGSAVFLAGPASSSADQRVTFIATVTGNDPTGSVQFKVDGTNAGSPQPLVSGAAQLSIDTLAVGAHVITAEYGGDGTNTGSTSNAITHTVYPALVSAIELATSANPATFGSTVTLTATVTGPGTVTGSVTFRESGSPVATVALSGGVAQLSTAAFPTGMRLVTADYTPDAGAAAGGNTAVSSATLYLAVEIPLDPAADQDGDGIPNGVERTEGTSTFVKDNDVFSATALSARLFAMQQYRDFLGREGDAAGISGWSALVLAGTMSRAQVIDAFVNSPEFGGFVAPVVRLYFATFLRVPDYAGLTYNAALVRGGTVTLTQLADFFAASPEFQARYGALDDTAFVTLLYGNVLGRAPDAAGLAGWVSLLAGGMSRGQVMLGFSESPEYQAAMANEVLVTMMYTAMLRRTPESAGFNGWLALLDAGSATRAQVIDGFFLSTEYRGRFLP